VTLGRESPSTMRWFFWESGNGIDFIVRWVLDQDGRGYVEQPRQLCMFPMDLIIPPFLHALCAAARKVMKREWCPGDPHSYGAES